MALDNFGKHRQRPEPSHEGSLPQRLIVGSCNTDLGDVTRVVDVTGVYTDEEVSLMLDNPGGEEIIGKSVRAGCECPFRALWAKFEAKSGPFDQKMWSLPAAKP